MEPKKVALVVRGWSFPDEPPRCPRGVDQTQRWVQVIRALSVARKLVGSGCRPAYYAMCVAEAYLRNRVMEARKQQPCPRELLQSELHSPGALSEAARAGSA